MTLEGSSNTHKMPNESVISVIPASPSTPFITIYSVLFSFMLKQTERSEGFVVVMVGVEGAIYGIEVKSKEKGTWLC